MRIFIFGLVIAFFIFKIGYWSDAYADNHNDFGCVEVDEKPLGGFNKITYQECLDVLRHGNVMAEETEFSRNDGYMYIIYGDFEYTVSKIRIKGGMTIPYTQYKCLFKLKLQMCYTNK